MLANLQPELSPGDGVGTVQRTVYSVEIRGTKRDAAGLIDLVCERICDVMPIEFAAEPHAPEAAEEGTTLTGAIPGRGNIQVRLEERTPLRALFVTLEGHPLAGLLTFAAEDATEGVRFSVEIAAQPANAADWVAMRTVGGYMQSKNWREVLNRVVDLSGGMAPGGVQKQSEPLEGEALAQLRRTMERLLHERRREQRTQAAELRGG
jgi:hypothetical protein